MTFNSNHKSFTLIELLVVIAVISVISAVVVVNLSGGTDKAEIAKIQAFSAKIGIELADSVVSKWNFDEATGTTTHDKWEGNDGIFGGGTSDYYPAWRSGEDCISGSCLEFDGTDDYVDCGNSSTLDVTEELTVETWVKINTIEDNHRIIDRGTAYFFSMDSSDNLTFSLYDTGYRYVRAPVQTDVWYHAVATCKRSDKIKLYVNGEFKDDWAIGAEGSWGNSSHLGFGNWVQSNGDPGYGSICFDGLIDEVRIYNSVASITQIQSNYLAGLQKLLSKGAISQEEYNQRVKKIVLE